MMEILAPDQVEEMMVEFARKYLVLDQRAGPDEINDGSAGILFEGLNPENGKQIALELITRIRTNGNEGELHSAHQDAMKRRVEGRAKTGIHTAIILPRAIDYSRAGMLFESPYCRTARLFDTARQDEDLGNIIDTNYSMFRMDSIKDLTRLEWEYLLPATGRRIAYFNPKTEAIENKSYMKFKEYQIIPDSRPLDQEYFWYFVRKGYIPNEDSTGQSAKIFRGIQEGLHDRIRVMRDKGEPVKRQFTVLPTNKQIAMIAEYDDKPLILEDNKGQQLKLFH